MRKRRKRKSPSTRTTSTKPRSSAEPSHRWSRRKKSTSPARKPRAAYLGLGSNLGDRGPNLRAALARIARGAKVTRVSRFYLSEPVGYADQPWFYNAVVRIVWPGTAAGLLVEVKRIERSLGRVPAFRNGPRVIDVDILDLGGSVRTRPDPVLPHPRLSERRFVLAPLAEIAPSWRHPVSGLTARQLLARLPRAPRVRRIRTSL